MSLLMFIGLISKQANAIGCVHPSAHLFFALTFEPTDLDLAFCMSVGHGRSLLGKG